MFGVLGLSPESQERGSIHFDVLDKLGGNRHPDIAVSTHAVITLVEAEDLPSCIRGQSPMLQRVSFVSPQYDTAIEDDDD